MHLFIVVQQGTNRLNDDDPYENGIKPVPPIL